MKKINVCWIDDIGQEFLVKSLEVTEYEDAIRKITQYHDETKEEAKSLVWNDLKYLTIYADSTDKELDMKLLRSSELLELG